MTKTRWRLDSSNSVSLVAHTVMLLTTARKSWHIRSEYFARGLTLYIHLWRTLGVPRLLATDPSDGQHSDQICSDQRNRPGRVPLSLWLWKPLKSLGMPRVRGCDGRMCNHLGLRCPEFDIYECLIGETYFSSSLNPFRPGISI